MPSGGPNRGQGRKFKPPEKKFRKRLISLPPETASKLSKVENVSELIAGLLEKYFDERTEQ